MSGGLARRDGSVPTEQASRIAPALSRTAAFSWTWQPARAGVLDGKNATTWAGGEKALAAAYPKIKVQAGNVVMDDGLITSNGGPISCQAAFELLAKLSSEKEANEILRDIQFDRLKSGYQR